jgi:hypothetical protein
VEKFGKIIEIKRAIKRIREKRCYVGMQEMCKWKNIRKTLRAI